ncbi:hypothetical protein C8A00DRAFT_35707 [Chaetomidium leptoderma]|uniref:2EXR domain-containing protein n=1 Tax=Chaetomidium leptoderma TaxID=669021 RepID=A0AAN6VHZ0_9PEZI|nr:hypothetical protein C8A00DRAFT_35707 [Chaetomidium leptoderma]
MKPKTFHSFPRLPKELRDAIWALAIRPEQPSAHFFTIFDSSKDDEWTELSKLAISHPLVSRCSLAAPECVLDGPAQRQSSWVRGNRSAYLMDSGLWTACTESREAIRRRFKVAERDMKGAAVDLETYRETHPDAPASVSFTSDGERRCCLTHPRTDLFLLRPFNATTANWEYLDIRVPIFGLIELEGFHVDYVGHVAIDYDPDWLRGEHRDMPMWQYSWASPGTIGFAIRAATDHLSWAENLWFVDYRIRRRPGGVLPTAGSRRQFHGNGCKFTEVQKGDAGWELNNLDWERDIFDFLEELWDRVNEYFHDHGEGSPYSDEPVSHYHAPNVGVLAYEEEC